MKARLRSGEPDPGGHRPGAAFNMLHSREVPMSEETIFSKIIRQEIPAKLLYQDELVSAFRDIHPKAPSHILIVPNKVIPTVNDVTTEDEVTLGRLFTVARQLAEQEGIAEQGYRLIVNCNRHGGQEVFHLHMHLLGGKSLGPMLSV
jgi:histidine triad (HIT) family protein